MTYDHAHPDSDLFNEKTLGDYLSRKAPWPCVVVGGEFQEIKDGLHKTSTDGIPSNSCGDYMDD